MSTDNMMNGDRPITLALETATRAGSICLARGDAIICSIAGDAAVSHSSNLIQNVDLLLERAGVGLAEIDLFAVAIGPGSFTGLRIGLATVKAFAEYSDAKCVGVPTLAAIAHAAGKPGQVVALMPAGRGEVFAQQFAVDGGTVSALDTAAHLSPAALQSRYASRPELIRVGEGLTGNAGENGAHEIPDQQTATHAAPLAQSVAALALVEYRAGNTLAPGELRAFYVRPSDAELKK